MQSGVSTTIWSAPSSLNVSSFICVIRNLPSPSGRASAPLNRYFIWLCWGGSKYSLVVKRLAVPRDDDWVCPPPRVTATTNAAASKPINALAVAPFTISSGVIRDELGPFVLRLQNQFRHLAHGTVTTARLRDVVRDRFRFRHAVGHHHRHARALQHTQVHDVVAHVANLGPREPGARQEAFHGGHFTFLLLDEEIYFQFVGAEFRRRGGAAGNPAGFEPRAPQQHETQSIQNVEPLDLLFAADENRGVGQHAVHVAEEERDSRESGGEWRVTSGGMRRAPGAACFLVTRHK